MNRRQSPGVTRIERLQKVESLAASDFTQNDAVGPMAQSGSQQVPNSHSWDAGLFAPCLKSHEVGLDHLDFRSIFNQHNSILVGNICSQGGQQRRLSTARSTTDEDVAALFHSI